MIGVGGQVGGVGGPVGCGVAGPADGGGGVDAGEVGQDGGG